MNGNATGGSAIALNYKKNVTRSFIPITPEQIDAKLTGNVFYVSRKYDGLLAVLIWDGTGLSGFNSSGNHIENVPCFDEAASSLRAAGIGEAVVATELYMEESGGRSRVYDAIKALADAKERGKLALAIFDIVSLDNKPFTVSAWKDTLDKLEEIFGKGEKARPVQTEKAANREEVKRLVEAWVVQGGAEGVVVRSELPLVFKIKPKYSLDAVVIGFSVGASSHEGAAGAAADEVRTLLLALMDENGGYHVIGKAGSGLAAEERKALHDRLMPSRIPSSYIETDSNHVAFYMVKPELVVQISANDVIFEDSSGPVRNQLLKIGDESCRRVGSAPGFNLISPVFELLREDKKAEAGDVRLGQITDLFYNPHAEKGAGGGELPKSELLRRQVYKKESGGKLMILKFLLWKTNKEEYGWPAYAAACVNYSSDRAEPLKQDMRVSSDKDQIEELYDEFVAANVKKGWEKVG